MFICVLVACMFTCLILNLCIQGGGVLLLYRLIGEGMWSEQPEQCGVGILIVWFCSTWGLAGELVGLSCLAPAEHHVIVGWRQGSVPDDARVNKREN